MARKELTVTIDTDNRDAGKVFFIREMPATQAEEWAARAMMAMMRSGVEIPENVMEYGLAGIASLGLRAMGGMSFLEAKPLLDEMMACVQIIPDPSVPNVRRALVETDIEEVRTRLRLRKEVFQLITGFSLPAGL